MNFVLERSMELTSLILSGIEENATDDMMWSWVIRKHLEATLPAFLDLEKCVTEFDANRYGEFLKLESLVRYTQEPGKAEYRGAVATLLLKAPGYDPERGMDQPLTTRGHIEFLRQMALRLMEARSVELRRH